MHVTRIHNKTKGHIEQALKLCASLCALLKTGILP